jgi:hypothetical protein
MPSELYSDEYYEEIRRDFLKLGSPDSADAVVQLLRIRDQLARDNVLQPYYSRGARRFQKFSRPEEYGNPFGGLLFSYSLSDADRVEILEYFGKDPKIIPWNRLGTRAQIIRACKITGMEVPSDIIAVGCGDPSCRNCGCN